VSSILQLGKKTKGEHGGTPPASASADYPHFMHRMSNAGFCQKSKGGTLAPAPLKAIKISNCSIE
jgi:hypothetical protein